MKTFLVSLLMIAVGLLLTGCMSDQRHAVASCAVAKTGVQACMETKGYDTDFGSMDCLSIADKAHSPFCYRPRNWFAALVAQFELIFESSPSAPEAKS